MYGVLRHTGSVLFYHLYSGERKLQGDIINLLFFFGRTVKIALHGTVPIFFCDRDNLPSHCCLCKVESIGTDDWNDYLFPN